MSKANPIHESLVDTENSTVNIETSADVIKPIFGYGRKLVNEAKIHVDSDGLRYDTVDPANVAMVGLDVPAEAFETFDVEQRLLGADLKTLMGALQAGRQRQTDEINLSVEGTRLSTVVQRDYDDVHMDLQNQVRLIDPDMIRSEPDIPELELPAEATVPRKLFQDVVNQVDTYSDYLSISSEGDALVFDGMGDEQNTEAVVSNVVDNDEDDVESQFSLDYLKDAIKAFKSIGADELTFKFGQEFPVRIEFTTELNEAEVSGYWFQAPRIHKEE